MNNPNTASLPLLARWLADGCCFFWFLLCGCELWGEVQGTWRQPSAFPWAAVVPSSWAPQLRLQGFAQHLFAESVPPKNGGKDGDVPWGPVGNPGSGGPVPLAQSKFSIFFNVLWIWPSIYVNAVFSMQLSAKLKYHVAMEECRKHDCVQCCGEKLPHIHWIPSCATGVRSLSRWWWCNFLEVKAARNDHFIHQFDLLITHKTLRIGKEKNTKQNCMDILMTECSGLHQETLRTTQYSKVCRKHVKIYECQWKLLTKQSPFWWEIWFINTCTDLFEILQAEWEKQAELRTI